MLRTLLLALTLAVTATPALAWGPIGHRVTGAVAEPLLSRKAAKAVKAIIGDETLAEASTWPDEMRSNPDVFWKTTANPWHYVTVPAGKTWAEVGAPPEGDAITALEAFAATLRDPKAPLADKQRALRFAAHIIGDLHQPLHAGNGTDRGGNDVIVKFFGEETNLHAVWDYGMIDRRQLSYTEYTAFLTRTLTPAQRRDWAVADPLIWVAESTAIRDQIYPTGTELSWQYNYDNIPIVNERLLQAGVRMAAWMNAVLG